MMRIRPATADEVPAIIELAGPSFNSFMPVAWSPELVGAMLANLASYGGYLRVADIDGQIVGFFAGLVAPFKPWADEKCGMELLFFVAPEHRSSRAGLLLLRDFETWGRAKGCASIAVSANLQSGGDRVGRLYEHMGFTPIETAFLKRID